MRKIVFAGNCQIFWLQDFYRRLVAPRTGDEVRYFDVRSKLSAEACAAIEVADLLVQQRLEFIETSALDGLAIGAERHVVPQVTASFLWPTAGRPHPCNHPAPGLPFGRFPDELGDLFLNRMIAAGVPPADAVGAYCAADLAALTDVGRRKEIVLGLQRERDAETGYDFAGFIEARFRSEPLFYTPNHPCAVMFREMLRQFLAGMQVPQALAERVVRSVRSSPMGPDALPVHPSIGRHFGICWATEDRRYEQRPDGMLTSREYADLYMRFAWNKELAEGMELSHGTELERSRALLVEGLRHSPQAARGHAMLGSVLARLDRLPEAIEEARAAVALDPGSLHYRIDLVHLLGRSGDRDGALQACMEIVAADPEDAGALCMLGDFLAEQGRFEEALAALRRAAETVAPYDGLEAHIERRVLEISEQAVQAA